jgi:hypothetical protein
VTDTLDDRELCMVLDIKLGSKIGTVLDRELGTVVVHHIKVGSKLGTFPEVDIKLDFKLGTVLDRRHRTEVVLNIKFGSNMRTGLRIKLGTGHESKLGSRL